MDSKCRIDADLNQHQEEQDQGLCKVCDRVLPEGFFLDFSIPVCIECEADGYWTGNVFIDAGNHAHVM